MCVIYAIRRHIFSQPQGKILLTRDFLRYGLRGTVDVSLHRLVRSQMLMRVADGVFVREGSKIPTVEEIANAKAERFGKKVSAHCSNLAVEMKVGGDHKDPYLFGTDGPTSSFDSIHGMVKLVRVCGRKRGMGESPGAKAARALWYVKPPGEEQPDVRYIAAVFSLLNRDGRKDLSDKICWMPAWLSNQFVPRFRRQKIIGNDGAA
jgi:hypothetical protein